MLLYLVFHLPHTHHPKINNTFDLPGNVMINRVQANQLPKPKHRVEGKESAFPKCLHCPANHAVPALVVGF